VYFGGVSPAESSDPDLILRGDSTDGDFGACVAGGQDVNGDGFSDIVVGAPMASPDGHGRGRVYVFYGGHEADSLPDDIIDGEADGGRFGISLGLADVTGDGTADMIVGAPGFRTPSVAAAGHVYVYDLTLPLPARAFLDGGARTIPLVSAPAKTCVYFETVGDSYRNSDVDVTSLRLASDGTGRVAAIAASSSKTSIQGDRDRNGVLELSACFARQDLLELLSNVRGRRTVEVALKGRLTAGRRFRAPLSLTVVGTPNAVVEATVTPNPLNPSGVLTFTTSKPGRVAANLYDVHGRLVRRLVEDRLMPAGTHSARIDGRNDSGQSLASGVYYYEVKSADGTASGRVVVLK
jgi:hypothetical protein